MAITKHGEPIRTLADWFRLAPPKNKEHWVPNRSAMEIARSWLNVTSPQFPSEIADIFRRHSSFGSVELWQAEPEARLVFDEYDGEPRNADLAVYARDNSGDFIVAVEAKADETFGQTIGGVLATAVERRIVNPRSNGIARVEHLVSSLFGRKLKNDPPLNNLRYQLLTATAGALCVGEARNARRVVVLIQEFVTCRTRNAKQQANARDLDRFLALLSHSTVEELAPNVLYGPFVVPGRPMLKSAPPDLFVGKAVCNLLGK